MQKLRLVAAFALMVSLGLWLSCEGFFVKPVLTGLVVGPAATIQTGNSVQMSAVGTFDDGSQKHLTSGVYWSSGTPNVASISKSGTVTGAEPGQTTITGAAETLTATATITVTLVGLTSIQVTTQDGVTSIPYGNSEQFVATGTANGQKIDITTSVTWSTSPNSITDVNISSKTGLLTTTSGSTNVVQFAVVATDPTTNISGQINFIVHP